MGTFEANGRVFEVTASAPVDKPGFHYECWDLTPEGLGFLGAIIVPADDGPSDPVVDLAQPVTAPVLRAWIEQVPGFQPGDVRAAD